MFFFCRCLEALGEWSELHQVVEKNFNLLTEDNKQKASRLAAASSFGLHDYRSMERYVNVIQRDTQDGAFYRAILAIHKEDYEMVGSAASNSEVYCVCGVSGTKIHRLGSRPPR